VAGARGETRVTEYKDAKEYERDARKMVKVGWQVAAQSHGPTRINFGRTVFTTAATFGLNMLVPKIGGASYTKGKITVTWIRDNAKKKACPRCAEQVQKDARICRFCGHDFTGGPGR